MGVRVKVWDVYTVQLRMLGERHSTLSHLCQQASADLAALDTTHCFFFSTALEPPPNSPLSTAILPRHHR